MEQFLHLPICLHGMDRESFNIYFSFFSHFLQVHYMYFAMLLFWTTILLAVVVSLLTKPIPEYRVR